MSVETAPASSRPIGFGEFVQRLREDRVTHWRELSQPGFRALAVYRFGCWQESFPAPVRTVTRRIHLALYRLMRNVYGIELPRTATVGRFVRFGHQHGIVIHPVAVIGDHCMIRHGVTLGSARADGSWAVKAPTLGDRVEIGVGAVIAGAVTVGDGAVIGPNAVVLTDVAPGATVFAPASRQLRPR